MRSRARLLHCSGATKLSTSSWLLRPARQKQQQQHSASWTARAATVAAFWKVVMKAWAAPRRLRPIAAGAFVCRLQTGAGAGVKWGVKPGDWGWRCISPLC